jgi:translation initiation factor 4G
VRTELSEEDRASYSQSVFTDFLSSASVKDAVAAAQELVIPGFGPTLVDIGVNRAYDTPHADEQAKICSLVVELVAHKVIAISDVLSTVETQTKSLDDTMLDVPAAPKILGDILGAALAKDMLEAAVLGMLAAPEAIEGAEARRGLLAAALQQVKAARGEQEMKDAIAGLDIVGLMAKDDEIEGYLPSTAEFLAEQALDFLV